MEGDPGWYMVTKTIIYTYIHKYKHIYIYTYLYLYLKSIYLSFQLSFFLSIQKYISISMYIYIYVYKDGWAIIRDLLARVLDYYHLLSAWNNCPHGAELEKRTERTSKQQSLHSAH